MSGTLDGLQVGDSAEIIDISSDCNRAGRMATLGFIPGRRVTVTRLAPLGIQSRSISTAKRSVSAALKLA